MSIGRHAVALSALILCTGLLVSCQVEEPVVERPAVQSFPSSEATNATTVFLTGAIVTTRIKSARIIHHADRDSSWAYTLFVDFFDESGTHTSILTADSAYIREHDRFLEVYGDVRIATDDGRTLVTDRLTWDDALRRIHTDSYVEITENEDLMTGYGFDSNPELTDIKLKRVTGRIIDPAVLDSF
jgi:LPS export ABC transporter protein LptC